MLLDLTVPFAGGDHPSSSLGLPHLDSKTPYTLLFPPTSLVTLFQSLLASPLLDSHCHALGLNPWWSSSFLTFSHLKLSSKYMI